jgi:hypothetical protein
MRYHHFAVFFILSAPVFSQAESWEKTRHLAEVQHEIVMLLIEKGEFEKVPQAATEIFQMNFPQDQEHLILVEVEILVDALIHHKQITVAHQVVDSALKCKITSKSKAQLHREKGYLFKQEGKTEQALESFQMSKKLEEEG